MFGAQTRSPAEWGGDHDPPKRLRYTPAGKVPEFSEFPRWGPCRTILLVWEKTKKSANILKLEVDRLLVLCGGNSKIFYFHPKPKGNDPI